MKSIRSKIVSIILVLSMLISMSAFAATAVSIPCDCDNCPSIVIPGLFQSDVRYLDENGEPMLNSEGEPYSAPFFMEASGDVVKKALEEALVPLASLLLTQRDIENRCANAIADVLGWALFSNLELDEYGRPIKNIQADKYNTSFANLTDEQVAYALDQIPLNDYIDIAGSDHLYFLSYVHTGNIIDTANELYELIQIAKRETGHDKVNLVPISQGGSIANALMQLYIDKGEEFSDDVNRVCYVVPAADGACILGDIYRYGFIDDPEALYGYMVPSLMDEESEYLAYIINIVLRLFPEADLNNILDTAVHTLVEDYFERSTCLWGLIPSYDYPTCREMYLSDADDIHIREQTDWYYNAQVNSRKHILDAQSKGVEIFDIVDYNYVKYKIFDNWDNMNSDGIIHTDSESFGATSVAVDVSLPDDYVQANTYCTDPENHNHIDEERLVDASSGILCERSFYFVNQNHESTARNDVIIRLVTRMLTDSSFDSIYSDPAFPQFNYARNSIDAIELYENWKDYDASTLDESTAKEFKEASAELCTAIQSTYMPTEEFDAAVERFENVVYIIENGEPKDTSEDGFMKVITIILRITNTIMFEIFGGNGFSDMFFK
mgnify:CR=1 FL=1